MGWGRTRIVVPIAAIAVVLACKGTEGSGVCSSSCPQTCSSDTDCTSGSELCCDLGGGQKACVTPNACPKFCKDDSVCDTTMGEACCAANPASTDTVCSSNCPKPCAQDSECDSTNPRCCADLAHPICTTVSGCPKTCGVDQDCQTQTGEVCCPAATLKAQAKQLAGAIASSVTGLCVPAAQCPKPCSRSQDCNTQDGLLCCDGICASSCAKKCTSDNTCQTDRGELCCENQAIDSPWWGFVSSKPGPPGCNAGRCSQSADCVGAGQVCCDAQNDGCTGCTGICTPASTCSQSMLMTCP